MRARVCVFLCVFFTITDRSGVPQPYPVTYAVANPVRGLLDRKRSEEHPLSFNGGMKNKQNKTKKRDKKKEKTDMNKLNRKPGTINIDININFDSLSVETRRRCGLRTMVFPGVRPFRAPIWCPSGGWRTREARSTVAESLVVLYRVGTHQIRRRRRATIEPGGAEPFCARIKSVNREVSEGKADV